MKKLEDMTLKEVKEMCVVMADCEICRAFKEPSGEWILGECALCHVPSDWDLEAMDEQEE